MKRLATCNIPNLRTLAPLEQACFLRHKDEKQNSGPQCHERIEYKVQDTKAKRVQAHSRKKESILLAAFRPTRQSNAPGPEPQLESANREKQQTGENIVQNAWRNNRPPRRVQPCITSRHNSPRVEWDEEEVVSEGQQQRDVDVDRL